ncbi:MAG: membrane protein insertion efficiency factor YidD [Oceanicaulis sp.]|nr:membrane protein insertion efficiency factor YidD [Oceanicaulis sp.]
MHGEAGQPLSQRTTKLRSEGFGSVLLSLPARTGLLMIGAYKVIVSPVFYALGVRCRHEPTCSSYAADVIRAQGLWRGGWLTLGRVMRCRPGGSWGVDPAPLEPNGAPWWRIWSFRSPPEGNEGKT